MMRLWAWVGRVLSMILSPFVRRLLIDTNRARVVVQSENKILLMQDWLSAQYWTLPGGGIHTGETPQMTARRELKEETGITVPLEAVEHIETFAATTMNKHISYRASVCFIELKSAPQVRRGWPEVLRVRWFDVDDLPVNRDVLVDRALEKTLK